MSLCLFIHIFDYRPLPNGLLKKKQNSDLLYLDVHEESSSYHRSTKDHFHCISLLANVVCRQVITCPLSFEQ